MAECWEPQDDTCALNPPVRVEWGECFPEPSYDCVPDEYDGFDCGFDSGFG